MPTKTTAITKAKPAIILPKEQVFDPSFDGVRQKLRAARGFMTQAVGFMVLAGLELKRLKKEHGIQRGGDRKTDQTRNGSGLLKWSDLVKQELNITDDTANKYIEMAENAKKRVTILQNLEEQLLTTPLHLLDQREEVERAVLKITDGKTAATFMEDCGIIKKPAKIKESDRNQGGNSTVTTKTPEQEAQEYFLGFAQTAHALVHDVPVVFTGHLYNLPLQYKEGQDLTNTICLQEFQAQLTELKGIVDHAVERIAKAMHASKNTDPTKRETEARDKVRKLAMSEADKDQQDLAAEAA